MYETLKKTHPIATVLPTHMGHTWSKQDNADLNEENKHVPHLKHYHDSAVPDQDLPSEAEPEEVPFELTGNNDIDGQMLFKEYQKHYPQADRFLYWNKISKKWDLEALQEDIYIEQHKGTIQVLKPPEEKKPDDMIEIKESKDGRLILPPYEGWDEVNVKFTDRDIAVHYTGDQGIENLNDMYRNQTHYSIQQRLAHFNRDLARNDRLHRAKGMYTLMKMRKTDYKHYQDQRKSYRLNKKTGLGVYRPETDPYLSLHWKPTPDMKAVYYTDYLMREHHEAIDDDPNCEQFVTVKAVDSLGFQVDFDQALHEHNANRFDHTKKLTDDRKQEIEREQRLKAQTDRAVQVKAGRSM